MIVSLSSWFVSYSYRLIIIYLYLRSYFFEALAQCGSTPCVNILANLIMTNKVSADRANDLISSMNFIQEPSTAMLNTVMVSVIVLYLSKRLKISC